jgi:hypothetical protein
MKGARAAIWNRPEDAENYFQRAGEFGAEIDETFLSHLVKSLLDYEKEFGNNSALMTHKILLSYLAFITDKKSMQQFNGLYMMNSAFQSYHDENYEKVLGRILQAISFYPKLILNRGLHAILLRSIFRLLGAKRSKKPTKVENYYITQEQ